MNHPRTAWRFLAPSLLALALQQAPFASMYAADEPWAALTAACEKPPLEAEAALEELLRRDPSFLAARFNLGTLLISKDPARAAEQLTFATHDSNLTLAADAWHNLALARWHQGRLDEALQAADSAATLNVAYLPLRDELRRAAIARADEARRKAEEEAKRLAVDTVTLPEARVGEAYRAVLPVHGGAAPYRMALAPAPTPASPPGTTVTLDATGAPTTTPAPAVTPPSPVPPGLSLNADGTITGMPSVMGTYRIPVLVTDSVKAEATGTMTIVVLPQPAITTATLPEAIIGQPYTAQLSAEGLRAPRWSASGLPTGLSCDPSGFIRGTPTTLGESTVALSAADPVVPPARVRRAERALPLAVTNAFAPDAPPAQATAGAAYEHRVGVRGPAQAYVWSATEGPLTVDPDGRLHGTPAAEGTITRPATIHAADGRSREVLLSVPVNPRPLITASEPFRLRAGQPADIEVPHSGGTAPFIWKVGDGALPPGLRLDPDGHLRGVAKDPGSYTVTVQLEDRWKARTQASLALTVEPAPQDDQQDKKDKQPDQQTAEQQKPGDDQKPGEQPKPGDGKKPGDDQKPGEQAKGGDEKEPGKDPAKEPGKDQAQKNPAQQDQGQDAGKDPGKDQGKDGKSAAAQAAAGPDPAAQLNQLAADRWLDQLPAENREVLRYQLLEGGERRPASADKQGNSW